MTHPDFENRVNSLIPNGPFGGIVNDRHKHGYQEIINLPGKIVSVLRGEATEQLRSNGKTILLWEIGISTDGGRNWDIDKFYSAEQVFERLAEIKAES